MLKADSLLQTVRHRVLSISALAIFSVALTSGCQFRRPANEVPAPRPAENVVVDKRKGFFGSFSQESVLVQREILNGRGVVLQAARYEPRTVYRPRTFLCGWASEAEAGELEDLYEHAISAVTHCNVEFEITASALIAREVKPGVEDRDLWEIVMTIPIEKHFYLEARRDASGRDTTEQIENERSDYRARPFMRLKLAEMEITKVGYAISGLNKRPAIVEDVEWDEARGFLGFSATMNNAFTQCRWTRCFGANGQAKFRVNFMAFESNPNFAKTPFHDSNYKYMNVLHVMGRRVDSLQRRGELAQVTYGAHWDLNKNPKLYLYKVPPNRRAMIEQVVAEWNASLRKVGALRPDQPGFTIAPGEPRHAFDLRYPNLVWVDDFRISSRSPLGVGMANADVRTGEIIWGSITIFSGMIDQYIKGYLPMAGDSVDAAAGQALASSLVDGETGGPSSLPPRIESPAGWSAQATLARAGRAQGVASATSMAEARALAAEALRRRDPSVNVASAEARDAIEQIATRIVVEERAEIPPVTAESMATEMAQLASFQRTNVIEQLTARPVRARLITPLVAERNSSIASSVRGADQMTPAEDSHTTRRRLALEIAGRRLRGNVFDTDRTLGDVAAGWAAAAQEINPDEYPAIIERVLKELVSHEYGHWLGLGHQFKENIVPDDGTVPELYLAGHNEDGVEWKDLTTGKTIPGLKARATAAAHFQNMTSVMGYRDPRSEIHGSEEWIKPGPQDELTLQYLYTQRYSVFKTGDRDFTPVAMDPESDGVIPRTPPNMPGYKTAYFPQCNDLEASFNMDPFCNRFDRGATATDIVKNYVADLTDNLSQTLTAFSDSRGGDEWSAYVRLWLRAHSTMARVRLFYDYMRRGPDDRYRSIIDEIRRDENLLYDFSRSCTTAADDVDPRLKRIMAANPDFKELCNANALAMTEYKRLLSINSLDHSRMDRSNGYVPGGMRGGEATQDFSRLEGSWVELSGLPIKYATLGAMLGSRPWAQLSYWRYGVPGYSDPDATAMYSWLYPREYTEAVSATVKSNLRFAGVDRAERTTMGLAILNVGYWNWQSHMRSDAALFPSAYVDRVRSQTSFSLRLVAIIMRGDKKEGVTSETRVDRFSGDVVDFEQGERQALSEAYLLPDGQVVVRAPNMFLFPITKFKLFNDRAGYVFAYKLDYFRDPDDRFSDISVKSELKAKHDQVLRACVSGPDGQLNGLSQFFNKTEPQFEGFFMADGLYQDPEEKGKRFLRSVREQFERYYSAAKFRSAPPRLETCTEAIRGLGLIISSAAVINGYWLPEVNGYLDQ